MSYMRAVLRIAFGQLADVAADFQRLFAGEPACCAGAFVLSCQSSDK